MDVYGLTGGIGSGKSTVATILEDYGIPVVSADELSRVVVAPGTEGLAEVVAAFGDDILAPNGELDRQAMAYTIFRDAEARAKLEEIIHPKVRERFGDVLRVLAGAGHPLVIYEIPLLFEKQLESTVKGVIAVVAREDLRIARVKSRSGISTEDIRRRMATQVTDAIRQERADYVVRNNGDLVDLRQEVERMITRYLRLPGRKGSSTEVLVEVEDIEEIELPADMEISSDEIDVIDVTEIDVEPEAAPVQQAIEISVDEDPFEISLEDEPRNPTEISIDLDPE